MSVFSDLFLVSVSAALAAALIVAIRPLLAKYAIAKPSARSSHKLPTPQGGGVGVVGAILIATPGATMIFGTDPGGGLWALLACVALLAAVGAADDFLEIGVAPRLLAQAVATGVVIAFLPPELRVVHFLPWAIERLILFVSMLWFINLVNFMDGIDWMTVAEIVPISATLGLLGTLGALPKDAVFVSLVLLGATLGFAPFNRPIARLFLGDVGSLPIGLVLGWLLLLLAGAGNITAALLLPLYYLGDATLTLALRSMSGKPILQAHRTHFYQRATEGGFTVPQVVGHVFVLNVALAILAVTTVQFPSVAIDAAALALGVAVVGWVLRRFTRGKF